MTDGPFVEAKEQLAGYYIVDCETVERAVEIAARWPDAAAAGRWRCGRSWTSPGAEM